MAGAAAPVLRVLAVGSPSNRLLRGSLLVIYLGLAASALLNHLIGIYPFMVDLEIPLRAAGRWVVGGEVYQASAFTSPHGATQPFLYPPFVLPFLTLLVDVPRILLQAPWFAVCLGAALFSLRRLGFPILTWPLALAWPPFAEGIIAGNVQVVAFACFVALFWRPSDRRGRPWTSPGTEAFRPTERDVADRSESAIRLGLLSAAIGAIKIAQFQPWLVLVRHRSAAAAIGLACGLGLVAVTLPITGLELWRDWLGQLQRAADPTWDLGGIALGRFTPPGVGSVVLILTSLTVLALPSVPRAGVWVGVLSVLGTPSLHTFGMLFLVPAMEVIRRELALLAAIFITTYSYPGSWAGIMLVAISLVATLRWPHLLEEPPAAPGPLPVGGTLGEAAAP